MAHYLNKAPAYGSPEWCKKVAANENLTAADYMRFSNDLRCTGNMKGLLYLQQLLKEKYALPNLKSHF